MSYIVLLYCQTCTKRRHAFCHRNVITLRKDNILHNNLKYHAWIDISIGSSSKVLSKIMLGRFNPCLGQIWTFFTI